MQRLNRLNLLRNLNRELKLYGLLLILAAIVLPGCDGSPGSTPSVKGKPFDGTRLTFACTDGRLRSLLDPMVQVWAQRTGAKVELRNEPMRPDDSGDVGVVGFSELGGWAARGDLLAMPAAFKEPGHPLQWTTILDVYRGDAYAGWGGQTYGLPLAADGHVLLYRADRFADPQVKADFRTRTNRILAAPTVWEDFTAVATYFAKRDKHPSVAFTPSRTGDLFFCVAACYDRQARRGSDPGQADSLEFQFRLDDGRPRIDGIAFKEAAEWLANLKAFGCLTDGNLDPVAALEKGDATLAVVSLADLTKHPGKADSRLGIAPMPGSRSVLDPATGQLIFTPHNYVPYFSDGFLGVVRKGCKNSEAAFDLLAELGGPRRCEELVAAGGFGPIRESQLEADRLLVWLGYGFDERRSKDLQEALRAYVGKAIQNPTYGLRTPDAPKLQSQLTGELAAILEGKPAAEALGRAAESWKQADAGVPRATVLEWRRRAIGLN
jgi:multiple sugar transport system substrate-binding protein